MNKSKTIINRFPKVIQYYLGEGLIKMISIGRNGDKVFKITSGNSFILKVSSDINRLEHEKEIYEWLFNNQLLPVPEVLFWYKTKNKGYLITKFIKGKMASDKYYFTRPLKLINICNDAIKMIKEVDITKYPHLKDIKNFKNKSLSHGDLSLSNIIIKKNNIVGFLAMGNASIRDIEYDFNTLIRSFEYNLENNRYRNNDKNNYTKKIIEILSKSFDKNII